MKVLLISANTERVNMLPLPIGLICVAVAARNAGHEVKLIDLMAAPGEKAALEQVHETVRNFRPQAIGLSVRNIDNQDMAIPVFFLGPVREFIDECRKSSDAPVILGGAGYSIFPQSALAFLGADMGIRGEGEKAFVALLDRLREGADVWGLPGVYLRGRPFSGVSESLANLDELPFPDPRVAAQCAGAAGDIWMPFQTRRGCQLSCSYCSTPIIEGRRMRSRSLDRVIGSLADHVDAGFQRFWFVDNTFNLPFAYSSELCRHLIASGLKIEWRCIIHPGVMEGNLAELLARAGCVEAGLGFESGSDGTLRGLNKDFRPSDVAGTSRMLKSAGIRLSGFLLFGGPGETKDTVLESLAFADGLELESGKVTAGIRIYPETALAKAAVADGLVSPDDNLLLPRFYMVPGLEKWLRETLEDWMKDRPNWSF